MQSLGTGQPLENRTRDNMENAFGTGFSDVRVHTDGNAANLSRKMDARAFTVGNHVAFGAGEHRPGSMMGDALIAHELAHVQQQKNAGNMSTVQQKGQTGDYALEIDADSAAIGAVTSIYSGSDNVQGKAQRKMLPRLRSGLRLQRCATAQKKVVTPNKTPSAEEINRRRFRSEKLDTRDKTVTEYGELLQQVNTWAKEEQRKQTRVMVGGVIGMDPAQLQNASRVANGLRGLAPMFNASGLNTVKSNLQDADNSAKSARKYADREEIEFQNVKTTFLNKADDNLNDAVASLEGLSDNVDGYEFWVAIEEARSTLAQLKQGKIDEYEGFKTFGNQLKTIRENIVSTINKYNQYPDALARISFLLDNFVSLNTPGFAGGPTAAEIKKMKGTLDGNISSDFQLVFGGGVFLYSPYELFVEYATVLEKQLAFREKMEKAGISSKTPIPSQGDVEGFFKSLKSKSNDEVFNAYTEYARAYFYHSIVASISDMKVKDVSQLFARDLSITGLRPLVCSGYALLGEHMLALAGARLTKFTSAVRATDDDVLNNTISAGHAIAQMSRNGKQFFVSNYLIVFSENEAIGPDAVAWEKAKAPLFKASGSSNSEALAALEKVLQKKEQELEKSHK